MTEHHAGADPDGGTGPLAAEALRLVSSMHDWAQGWAERGHGEPSDAHASSDCQWCPLCQFVAVLRGERPDITERVAEAGTAITVVLRALVEGAAGGGGAAQQHRGPRPAPVPRVQKINLGDGA